MTCDSQHVSHIIDWGYTQINAAQRTINVVTVSMIMAQHYKHPGHQSGIDTMLDQCCCKVAHAGKTLTH